MSETCLIPPNLAKLGVARRGKQNKPDLQTIWLTPFPVLRTYEKVMAKLEWDVYGGGKRRGDVFSIGSPGVNGYITSGYRSEVLNKNYDSPHRHGFAIDVTAIGLPAQITLAFTALELGFRRAGIYLARNFVHLDLAPDNWIEATNGARFWIWRGGNYDFYQQLHEFRAAIEALRRS